MALVFNCRHCGESIAVRFLKVGELAKCRRCGKEIEVPEDASIQPDNTVPPLRVPADNITIEESPDGVAPKNSGLFGVPLYIRNLLIAGLIQILVINIHINMASTTVEMLGSQVMVLGNSKVIVTPDDGMGYLDGDDADERYDEDALLFALVSEPTEETAALIILADAIRMEGYTEFEDISRLIGEEAEHTIISSSVTEDYLSVTLIVSDTLSEPLYVNIRFLKAYPYYLRLRSYYTDGPALPSAITRALESVKVDSRW